MIYSVWNQGAWKYDYYESRSVQDTANAPRPDHVDRWGKPTPMGLAPEQLAWPLPPDAVKTGQGEYPRGRIGRRGLPIGNGSGVLGWRGDHPRPGDSDGLSGALAGIPIVEDIPPPLLALGMIGAFWYWRTR